MSDDRVLRELQAKLERAQQNPPQSSITVRKVSVPVSMRPSKDSRGQRRQVMGSSAQARQRQIERAKREMVAQAKSELVSKAKEQLKP